MPLAPPWPTGAAVVDQHALPFGQVRQPCRVSFKETVGIDNDAVALMVAVRVLLSDRSCRSVFHLEKTDALHVKFCCKT